jgi:hypothetical protein
MCIEDDQTHLEIVSTSDSTELGSKILESIFTVSRFLRVGIGPTSHFTLHTSHFTRSVLRSSIMSDKKLQKQ